LSRNVGKSITIYVAKRRFTGLILTVILSIQIVSYKMSNSRRYLCDVWGGVGGIRKTIYVICFDCRRITYLPGTPVTSARTTNTNRLVYEETS
jgi:hypothetical protein